MPDTRARLDFMKKLHLFHGLKDDQLIWAAEKMQEQFYPEEDTVFTQGMPADYLYLIYQGSVTITRWKREKETKLATLVRGDYFGEQGLLTGHTRNATVKAEKDTLLLVISREHFKKMLRKLPDLRAMFDIMMSSRELATKTQFKWLADNEVIYFLARKHPILLYQTLIIPLLLMLIVFGLVAVTLLTEMMIFVAVGAILGLVDVAWIIWRYIDWGNDFYIVTNQRVIWLEKVIGLYDSRNEASTRTILSVSTETNEFGRMFDYGTVVVRTFTGQIRMEYIHAPKQVSAMIEEYWMRTKNIIRSDEQESIKQAIRAKLGYAPPAKPAPPPPPKAKPKTAHQKRMLALQDWWHDAFQMRVEEGGKVTYRKHVFALVRATLPHNLAFIVMFSAPFLWANFLGAPPLWALAVLILGILIDVMLWIYEYMDWANDTYQVTADQIIRIEQKPFGEETRKSAPLENILSTEYKRTGLFAIIFNFGTVFVNVGDTQLNFENVADPPTVQQDIVRRQLARTQKKKEAETAGERERLAEWLAMYHRTVEDIQREQNQSKPGKPE